MKIYFDDAPVYVDDLAPRPAPPPQPWSRRGLRNWQKFAATYGMMTAGLALLLRDVVLRTGGNEAGGVFIVVFVAAVAMAVMLIVSVLAGRAGRL